MRSTTDILNQDGDKTNGEKVIANFDRVVNPDDVVKALLEGRLPHPGKKEVRHYLLGCLRPIRREPYKRLTSRRI